jgi:putative transposase
MSRPRLDMLALNGDTGSMQRRVSFAEGEYYHVYNRGTDKRIIFLDDEDYQRFIALLFLANSGVPMHRSDHKSKHSSNLYLLDRDATLVDIGAYCLMPNHFHILIREHSPNGISAFMQKLLTAYVMYFNKKYERRGALFEGPFMAEHVTRDEHLKYLYAYIHLNPIGMVDSGWKKGSLTDIKKAKEHLATFPYSSLPDYRRSGGARLEAAILNTLAFPRYFETPQAFESYVTDWIEGREIYKAS